MPLCYGGGIKTVDQALKIFSLGVEKIAISSGAIQNPLMVSEIASKVGNQSVVVVLDVRKNKNSNYEVFTHNGTRATGQDPITLSKLFTELGAGGIVINSIDNDGRMSGYDYFLIKIVRDTISTPLTVLGGAGKLEDLQKVINLFGIIGVAAGSLFVFKGPYKAVLINYPDKLTKSRLFQNF